MAELGETLRRARLDRGLTLDDVAQEIRIRSRYLAALEDEELQVLPGHAYARSFVRAYAGFLGLEPQPLLDELEARATRASSSLPCRRSPWPLCRLGPRTAAC
jgi:cytoskeletal protein RodZ